MNANPLAASPEEPLAGWRWLAVFAPFVLTSLPVLPWHIPFGIVGLAVIRALVLVGTLAFLLLTLIAGLILPFDHKYFARLERVMVWIPARSGEA